MKKTFNREINFILLCACVEPDGERRKCIENAADSSLNWDLVYEISLRQRVLPLLYENIKSLLPGKVPARIIEKLNSVYFDNVTRNISLSLFLLKILSLLKENNISAVPFKGPLLAQDVYGDIGLRPFSDLDILVSKNNAFVAWQILLEDGFQTELVLDDGQKHKYIMSEDHMAFSKGNMCVELHWDMFGDYLCKPMKFEDVEESLKESVINNREVPDLSSEDLLLYLCIHGAKHRWGYLEMVCCVAEVIKRKEINWEVVEMMAQKLRCQRIFAVGIYLSWKLLEAPIPGCILEKIKNERIVLELADEVIEDMFKEVASLELKNITDRFSFFHIKVRDSFSDKFRYVLKILFCPSVKEWQYFPVPASFSFVHYLLRPYRLIKTSLMGR